MVKSTVQSPIWLIAFLSFSVALIIPSLIFFSNSGPLWPAFAALRNTHHIFYRFASALTLYLVNVSFLDVSFFLPVESILSKGSSLLTPRPVPSLSGMLHSLVGDDRKESLLGGTSASHADSVSVAVPASSASAVNDASGGSGEHNPGKAKVRLESLDLLRGYIMVVMAWDHTKDFCSDNTLPTIPGSEFWSGPYSTYDGSAWLFISRWISHFCAPGFFYLMGIGMAMFAVSRQKQQWTDWQIVKHFAIRGALLVVFDRIINTSSYAVDVRPDTWKNTQSPPQLLFQVLTGLGLTMIVCGLWLPIVLRLRSFWYKRLSKQQLIMHQKQNAALATVGGGGPVMDGAGVSSVPLQPIKPPVYGLGELATLAFAILVFAVDNWVIVYFQSGDPEAYSPWPRGGAHANTFGELLTRFLLIPGDFFYGSIVYPLVPWMGVTLLGIFSGFEWASDPKSAEKRSGQYGLMYLALFFIIRGAGTSVGNFRGWGREVRPDFVPAGIWFLDVCKYPPSIAYVTMTLGVDNCLLYFFTRIYDPNNQYIKKFFGPALVYGRTPLFYYVIHFLTLGVVGAIIHTFSDGFYLPYTILIWATMVFCLYFICEPYGRFKNSTHPESLWRFL